jgi:TonB family protein
MNRLQKKCFVASAGFHLVLIVVLLVGPAFLMQNPPTQDVPLIDFVPVKTVDALMSGGGNPKAAPPPEPAPAPAPAEPAPTALKPEPALPEPTPAPKRRIEVNTRLVTRKPGELAEAKSAATRRAQDDARQQAAAAVARAAARVRGGVSPSTTVELRGPGGGGVPYANFLQAVKTVYTDAWVVPDGVTDDSATTTAAITIARDGTVISATITRFSGNAAVDHSVRLTLDRVRYAAPLPDDASENERTVTINFNVKAKLLG